MKPTEKELVEALAFVWEKLKPHIPETEKVEIQEKFNCVDEIEQFGVGGPVGMGLGRYGGHAVG